MIYLLRVWPNATLTNELVEQKLNEEQDWIRFDEMTWLVQSNRSAELLAQKLRPVLKKSGMHLIIAVDGHNTQGLMTQNFWEWINNRA
ncbi:hypothetical protein [Sorangium sp. So ce1153]|uniref:hypothetical protein n=1 Tax=Sorangium sp. So ce1153 TaxID=3133333 RepID=UPI003F61A3BF